MIRFLGGRLLPLIFILSSVHAEGRWSRQIQNQGFSPAAINDWIPLTQPCPTCRPTSSESSRENAGRVLNHHNSQNSVQTGPQVFYSVENQPQPQSPNQQFSFGPEPFQSQPPRTGIPQQLPQAQQLIQNPPQNLQPQLPQAQHLVQSPPQNIQQTPEAFQLHQHIPNHQRHNIPAPQHFPMRIPHQPMHLRQLHHEIRPHHSPLAQQSINFQPQQFVLQNQPQHHAVPPPPQFFEQQHIPPFVHLPPAPQPLQQQPEQMHFLQLSQKPNPFTDNNQHMFQRQPELNFNHHQHHTEVTNRPQASGLVQHKPGKNMLQNDEKLFGQHKFNLKQQPPYQIFQQEQQVQNHQQPSQLLQQQNQSPPEEVQLVYVPLETLYQQQQQQQQQNTGSNSFNLPERVNPGFINTLYDNERKPQYELNQKFESTPKYTPPTTTTTTTTTTHRPTTRRSTTTHRPTYPSTTSRPTYQQISSTTTPRGTISVSQRAEYFQTSTTPKPHKPKTHQPPLAMFMHVDKYKSHVSENDVISSLNGAKTIDVIDTVTKRMPKVFIGPYGLETPEGYSKFDLPYLSSIDQHRFDRQADNLPFFVAPHSFKIPNGFNKIALPSPHVGAVLIKAPQEQQFSTSYHPEQDYYTNSNPTTPIRSSTPHYGSSSSQAARDYSDRHTYNHDHQFATSTPNNIYSTLKTSTSRPSTRYTQETIQERPRDEIIRGKRPQYEYEGLRETTVQKHRENKPVQRVPERKYPTNSYVQVQPSVTHDVDESYATEATPIRSSTYQTARPTTQSTKAQEEYQMKSYFREQDAFKNRPPIQLVSSTERPYESSSLSTPHKNRFSTLSNENNDNYNQNRFSFNQFDAVKTSHTTAQPESASYTREPSHHSSQTPRVHNFKLVDSVTAGPSTVSYSPLQQELSVSSVAPEHAANYQDNQRQGHRISDSKPHNHQHFIETSPIPSNHQPQYQQEYPVTEQINNAQRITEIISQQSFDQYIPSIGQQQYAQTEEANRDEQLEQEFNLSPDMPTINPYLPGMINSLMDMKEHSDEPETTTQAFRRAPTVVRPRRPLISSQTTQATTTYQPETTIRPKSATRGRRPNYNTRGTTSGNYQTTTSRTSSNRNPNRVRYNPSPEERQRFRSRGKTSTITKSKEEDNIEYQRDVLNQNYPVIKPLQQSVQQSSPQDYTVTTIQSPLNYNQEYSSTESNQFAVEQNFNSVQHPQPSALQDNSDHLSVYHESQKNNNQQSFSGLQEAMQIPENQNDVSNYPPVYYSRDPVTQEPERVTLPVTNTVNVRPIYIPTTRSTPIRTTTEEIPTTVESHKLRRPSFVKRPVRPNTYTTQSPVTTTNVNYDGEERFTVRSRSRQSVTTSQPPRIVKYRGRTRKPPTASSTETGSNENSYRGYNQYRRVNATSTEDYNTEAPVTSRYSNSERSQTRSKYRQPQGGRSRFALEAQESQWSQSINENSFQPSDFKSSEEKSGKNLNFDKIEEPEIVTAANDQSEGSFLLTVSHGLGDNHTIVEAVQPVNETLNTTVSTITVTTQNSMKPVPFVDMFEEFMSDYSHESPKKQMDQQQNESSGETDSSSETKNESTEDEKLNNGSKQGKRRGVWRRVRVRPNDGLETAESQNIRSHLYNTILSDPQKDLDTVFNDYQKNNLDKIEESFLREEVTTNLPEPINIVSDYNSQKMIDSTVATSQEDIIATTEVTLPETTEFDKEIITPAPEIIGETTFMPQIIEKQNVTDNKETITDRSFSLYDEYENDYDSNVNHMNVEDHDDPVTIGTPESDRSIFDEVKQKLSDLFAMPDDDDEDRIPINNYRSQYMDSHQIRGNYNSAPEEVDVENFVTSPTTTTTTTSSPITMSTTVTTPLSLLPLSTEPTKPEIEETLFSKNPLGNLIYATSTSTEISHETEICFRGRCIKTAEKINKKKKN